MGGCEGDLHLQAEKQKWQEVRFRKDSIVVGGLKLYVNIPKYGRELARNVEQEAAGKAKGFNARHETGAGGQRQPQYTITLASYATVAARNTRNSGQRWTQETVIHRQEGSHLSVQLNISMDEKKWFNDVWVG